jgi:hypothetical protein
VNNHANERIEPEAVWNLGGAPKVMELRYEDATHQYFHGDRELASVSFVMEKTGMIPEAYRFLKPEYRLRGTAVHTCAALICEGVYDESSTHPFIVPFGRQFQAFIDDVGFRPKVWECAYAHTTLGFAGRFDLAGLDRHDTPLLVDIKTGTALPPMVGVQLAAYDHLLTEGVRICPASDRLILNWAEKFIRDNPKVRFKKRALLLPGGEVPRGTLKSFDEPRWNTIWRSALTVHNARREAGLL